jgi:hypothetical protein
MHICDIQAVLAIVRYEKVLQAGPAPQSNVELRQFVVLCNCYHRFVEGYADIAAPLTRLCGPHAAAPWHWVRCSSRASTP